MILILLAVRDILKVDPIRIENKEWSGDGEQIKFSLELINETEIDYEGNVVVVAEPQKSGKQHMAKYVPIIQEYEVKIPAMADIYFSSSINLPAAYRNYPNVSFFLAQPVAEGNAAR